MSEEMKKEKDNRDFNQKEPAEDVKTKEEAKEVKEAKEETKEVKEEAKEVKKETKEVKEESKDDKKDDKEKDEIELGEEQEREEAFNRFMKYIENELEQILNKEKQAETIKKISNEYGKKLSEMAKELESKEEALKKVKAQLRKQSLLRCEE